MCELCCFVILLPQLAQDTEIRLLTHSQCTIYRQEKSFPEKFSLESYFRCLETISLKNDTNQSTPV